MGKAEAEDRVDVRGDGRVVLYKRPGLKAPKWQARIRVPNAAEYKSVTTKTTDLNEATRFALNLYEELYMHVKAGGSLKSKTFKQVYEEWKTHATALGPTRQGGSWQPTFDRIESYALKFFGPKRIAEVGTSEFTEYWAWRRANFNKKAPGNSMLRRENTCLQPILKHAVAKGYIPKVPATNPPKATKQRRPTFSPQEWIAIRRALKPWVEEGRKLATHRDRFVAMHYFLILANTGLRTGELHRLRWGDLWTVKTPEGEYLAGRAQGKTGIREFVFQPGSEVSVKLLYKQRCTDLEKLHPEAADPTPDGDGLVICHPDGFAIASMKNSFKSLLNYAKVAVAKDGIDRTPYSLRHFYATRQLSKETSPFLLARQMGTSVEMLEKHYGQTVTTSVAAQVTRSKPAIIEVSGTRKFPFSP